MVFHLCLLICSSHDCHYHELNASPLEMQGWLENLMCQFISSNFPCNRTTVHGEKKSNLNMGQVDEAGAHPDLGGMICVEVVGCIHQQEKHPLPFQSCFIYASGREGQCQARSRGQGGPCPGRQPQELNWNLDPIPGYSTTAEAVSSQPFMLGRV